MLCVGDPHVCSLASDTGPCYGYFLRFYYDQNSKSCKQFSYGGCDGNGNNFETESECLQKCAEKKQRENQHNQEWKESDNTYTFHVNQNL